MNEKMMVMMIIKREFIEYLDIKCLIKYFIYTSLHLPHKKPVRHYYHYYYYHSRFIEELVPSSHTQPVNLTFTPMPLTLTHALKP